MEIEVVEFYTIGRNDAKKDLYGTLHVYLCDLDIDIRGIRVSRFNNFWKFDIPFSMGIDEDTKEQVKYPVFSFTDREKQKELYRLLRTQGQKYIMENVLNKPSPIIMKKKPPAKSKPGFKPKTFTTKRS